MAPETRTITVSRSSLPRISITMSPAEDIFQQVSINARQELRLILAGL